MHGRSRVKSAAEVEEAKQKERSKKLALFQQLNARVFAKYQAKEYDDEAFALTRELLSRSPEIYTLWNYRRCIMLKRFLQTDCNVQDECKAELTFLEGCIATNPKCYWLWNHRRWLLEQAPKPDWKNELDLTSQFLNRDSRNFHCWDYRRHVARCASVSLKSEFEFTTAKIEQNFSNYSAWHYRSKLLPMIFADQADSSTILESQLHKEFDMVQSACFTEPEDQSAWFYYRWLLGKGKNVALADTTSSKTTHQLSPGTREVLESELGAFRELLELEPDSKWAILTSLLLMHAIDMRAHREEILTSLDRLRAVDPCRRRYYNDLRTRLLAELDAAAQ
ncbi:geranylgeranyltransferase type II [Capsaspora owczarzaki ATCC 30864]|uniref:Geranylgeranyl transferase type-2 subunit alpha n=1 Tax=Capsaspora owczarzaki (strain ATCC 30864) TaxID=595528 RepID=A0A0D2WWA9_CAPO3|nr:geranylgeranyltransferase type II [Capsaspora owczarzaki ATCC 30864]KJE97250.1 geranylgeranyltransferase type II [Capsaspora owczarzaki ATCC 30864]|eukprot:XP_004343563.2 geranylgeranyltransferase type II [Capsaspora owczarzaki ATCC 30864]